MDKYNLPNVKTFEFTKIIGIENIEFGHHIIIDDFVFIYAKDKIEFGNYIHIANFSSISGGGSLIMEDFSGLAPGCRIITGSDDFKDWGFGNPTINDTFRNVKNEPIKIERFAIVGTNSVILPGVIIGEGATVSANSLVTKNLEPWGIYIGNRRVGIRNKGKVLENYRNFLEQSQNERLGYLFREINT